MLSIKKDSVLKDYFLVKDRVADLWNAAFYNGRHVISSSSLLEANSESSTLFDMTFEEVISINRARDTLFNAVFIIVGIENQSSIDYHMPLKTLFMMLFPIISNIVPIKWKRRKIRKQSYIFFQS